MIMITLVDGHEEIFVTFHQLKSCRSTTERKSSSMMKLTLVDGYEYMI